MMQSAMQLGFALMSLQVTDLDVELTDKKLVELILTQAANSSGKSAETMRADIVAQLQGKVAKFALAREGAPAEPVAGKPATPDAEGLREMVWEILVKQLGHRPSEASQLITDALRRRPDVVTPEALFDEIYRGQPPAAVRGRG